MAEYELYHWGVKGMKWGVRRTEAQLARARGRVADLEKKLESKGVSAKSSSGDSAPARRSVKDMDDAELLRTVNRLNLEKRYNELNPEKVSAGKRFVKSLGKDVIAPAAKEAGKEVAKNLLKEVMTKALSSAAKTAAKNAKKD